ncbi:MAG: hypothetical protein JWL75_525 [Parcubacteria group bacterium]|nr:hypothetical protein [Parcubacteria group bacterium]
MEASPEIQEVLDTIRRENRHTRMVFGVGIIILAVVLMYLAPVVIRSQFANSESNTDDTALTATMHKPVPGKPANSGLITHSTTTSTTTTTQATSTKP